jgi:hypothetical protein
MTYVLQTLLILSPDHSISAKTGLIALITLFLILDLPAVLCTAMPASLAVLSCLPAPQAGGQHL